MSKARVILAGIRRGAKIGVGVGFGTYGMTMAMLLALRPDLRDQIPHTWMGIAQDVTIGVVMFVAGGAALGSVALGAVTAMSHRDAKPATDIFE